MLNEVKFTKSHEVIEINYPFHICQTDDFTNGPYRIAHFLSAVGGDNKVAPLSYYSNHVKDLSTDGEHLHAALGPRLRYWVGANSLEWAQQHADEINDLDTSGDNMLGAKEFVKAKGMDQFYETFNDIDNGFVESTIILRNPDTDFADTSHIPDLLSVTLSIEDSTLTVFANFGQVYHGCDFVNDLWFLSRMCDFYRVWFKERAKNGVKLKIFINRLMNPFVLRLVESNHHIDESDPEEFWPQVATLRKCAMHIRAFFNESTLSSDSVSPGDLIENKLMRLFTGEWGPSEYVKYYRITEPYLVDMLRSLMIYPLANCKYSERHEEEVMSLYDSMGGGLKYEVSPVILQGNYSMANHDVARSFINEKEA